MGAAHEQFAELADTTEMTGPIEDKQLHVFDSASEGNRFIGCAWIQRAVFADLIVTNRALGFCRAVEAADGCIREEPANACDLIRGQNIAAEKYAAHRRQGCFLSS